MLLSPDKEECRTLQVLLGAEGYDVQVIADATAAARACAASLPAGVVIGSYDRAVLESIIAGIKGDAKTTHIPLFLIIGTPLDRHVRALTVGSKHLASDDGLYQLYGEIEKGYLQSMGEL